MSKSVLVVGGGGREHALAWKLSQSPQVGKVFVSPGNAGTDTRGKIQNVALNLKDFAEVTKWCQANEISLVLIGPEDPLVNGISDHLNTAGVHCFGPSACASQIEASKEFSKKFMIRQGIPTASFQSFTDLKSATDYIKSFPSESLVVKASGLAAGKGVVVATSKKEAIIAVSQILQDKIHGSAGETVIIEECLEGEEVSCFAFTDGTSILCCPPSQDHKRLLDGDQGPNTGGMGAYAPYPKITDREFEVVKKDILQKTVDGLKAEGIVYQGLLYAGVMLTTDGPKTLEFNCRFGDPETQVILPLLLCDLFEICMACVRGTLKSQTLDHIQDKKTLGVVVVSGGYPSAYQKGLPISGLQHVADSGVVVFHAGTANKDGQVLTSGGRVLLVMGTGHDFTQAAQKALLGAAKIKFDGAFYRKDIGHRVLNRPVQNGLTYRSAGVDIEAGNKLVEHIKPLAKSTSRPGCQVDLGMFGGMFDVKAAGYSDPILVSGTDGVGTKLKIAQSVGCHGTIGIDLVAMCVNDILAHGAEPLFFLDYFACGKLSVDVAGEVIRGIADGCKQAGCALLGGETAEMPGMYHDGDYDLAGFTVGAVERSKIIPRLDDIKTGDVLIGVPSSGIHSNGYSLVRRIVEKEGLRFDSPSPFKTGQTLGHDLLTPTKIYIKSLLPCIRGGNVKAFAHITGGGLTENIPRVLPSGVGATLKAGTWPVPSVFGWLAEKGRLSEDELARTFNCGLGGVLITERSQAEDVIKQIKSCGEEAYIVGETVKISEGQPRVLINGLRDAVDKSWSTPHRPIRRKRVAVLISGSGTNLQALIDHTQSPETQSSADIVLVISNKAGVAGLTRAQKANIPTKVIDHKQYRSREEFDHVVHQALTEANVDIVCLAGFMRILSGGFVKKWRGRMLNIHPSLLPSFKGGRAHQDVLASGVRITGCTVHFVAEEVDAGAIVAQDAVPVYPGDTEHSLAERVKTIEHTVYPKALELIASERALLDPDNKIIWNL